MRFQQHFRFISYIIFWLCGFGWTCVAVMWRQCSHVWLCTTTSGWQNSIWLAYICFSCGSGWYEATISMCMEVFYNREKYLFYAKENWGSKRLCGVHKWLFRIYEHIQILEQPFSIQESQATRSHHHKCTYIRFYGCQCICIRSIKYKPWRRCPWAKPICDRFRRYFKYRTSYVPSS